jgi:hypothetical protein
MFLLQEHEAQAVFKEWLLWVIVEKRPDDEWPQNATDDVYGDWRPTNALKPTKLIVLRSSEAGDDVDSLPEPKEDDDA